MMVARAALISPTDFLRREAKSKTRHEYIGGVVCEMAGASRNHTLATRNVHGILYRLLNEGPCQNLDQDTKVWVKPSNAYFYPDATIACPPNFIDEANGVIDNPTVIFEVLSPGTANLDRGAKFANYRLLPSLRDYVLIDSERRLVEVFTLEQGEWLVRSYEDGMVRVPSVDVEVDMAELYRHVVLK